MNKAYKFFSMDPKELSYESGGYRMETVYPFGPEHPDEMTAGEWLKEHHEKGKKYTLIPVYAF